MSEVPLRVGVVGAGTMGSRMVQALLQAGFPVWVRDIDPAAERRAREAGATVVSSPRELAAEVDVALLSLPLPSDVIEVVQGEDGLLAASRLPRVIVDLSTVDPKTSRENHARARERAVGYLDAPVLGRPQGVGKWTLPVGGTPEALEQVRPVLQVLARQFPFVGPPGHGNIVKLLNNMMFGAINAVTAEIMAICARLGMAPETLFKVISESGAASVSNLFLELGPKMLSGDFTPAFRIALLQKDMALAIRMAEDQGIPLLVGHANQLINQIAMRRGFGEEDTSAAVKVYEEWLGVSVRKTTG